MAALLSAACSRAVPEGDAAAAGGLVPPVPLYAPSLDGAEPDLVADEAGDTGADEDEAFVDAPGVEELNGFYFVLNHDRPYLLLDEAITGPAGAPVSILYRAGEYAVAAWAPYLGDAVALGERAAPGQEVVVYREDGVACLGTTQEPVVLYRGMPAWGVDSEEASSRFVATVAEGEARSMVLAAPVTVNGGDCEGALWARPASLPPPRIYVPDGESTSLVDIDDDGIPEVLNEGSLTFRTERGWAWVTVPPAYRLCRLPAIDSRGPIGGIE